MQRDVTEGNASPSCLCDVHAYVPSGRSAERGLAAWLGPGRYNVQPSTPQGGLPHPSSAHVMHILDGLSPRTRDEWLRQRGLSDSRVNEYVPPPLLRRFSNSNPPGNGPDPSRRSWSPTKELGPSIPDPTRPRGYGIKCTPRFSL